MLSTVLIYVTLGLSILAFVLSFISFQLSMTRYKNLRDVRSLQLQMAELDDLHAALSASHKRLRSRVGMRELRERRKSEQNEFSEHDSAPMDPAEWKKQKRLELAKGELKPR